MIRYQLTDIQRKQVTWPLDVIYEESGFAGYIMPRLHSAEDFTVVCGAGIEEINLEDRLFIGYNICAAVRYHISLPKLRDEEQTVEWKGKNEIDK